MKKFITEEMFKQIIVYACSLILAIGAFIVIWKFPLLVSSLNNLFSILFPFILGMTFAFVLYRPELWIEKQLKKLNLTKKESRIRVISALIVFIITILLLVIVVYYMVPAIISSIQIFAQNIGIYGQTLYSWVEQLGKQLNLSTEDLEILIRQLDLSRKITTYLTDLIPKLAGYSYSLIMGAFQMLLAIVAGLYILIDHEHLQRTIKKLTFATLDLETSEYLSTWIIDAKTIFQKYIVGSLMDSLVIGTVVYLGMTLFKIPYAPLIGIVIGITNIIPVFGPFIGSIPVAFLLLLIKPIYSIIFLIYVTVIQQIDGNVFKPIILGEQLGISGFWILFSVTVGGGLFGIIGMFLGVPVFALIYQSLKRYTDKRLYRKHINIDET